MSLSVLIVEDEPIIAEDLAISLEEMGYSIHGVAASFDEAVSLLSSQLPDIAILDIMIHGEKSGIDLGLALKDQFQIPFVYLTSMYDRSTVEKANKTEPLGYIVKPFKESDLQVGLQLAWKRHKKNQQSQPSESKPIFVRKEGTLMPLNPEDILYVEASDNYSTFHTQSAKFVVSQTLKNIEGQLLDQGFCRVHKTFLINLTKIDLIDHSVVYINSQSIPIGKVYRKDFLAKITVF